MIDAIAARRHKIELPLCNQAASTRCRASRVSPSGGDIRRSRYRIAKLLVLRSSPNALSTIGRSSNCSSASRSRTSRNDTPSPTVPRIARQAFRSRAIPVPPRRRNSRPKATPPLPRDSPRTSDAPDKCLSKKGVNAFEEHLRQSVGSDRAVKERIFACRAHQRGFLQKTLAARSARRRSNGSAWRSRGRRLVPHEQTRRIEEREIASA